MKYWDVSWNPVSGCSPCSPGCDNCWAKRMAYRLKGRFGYPTDNPFKVTFHPERLDDPLKWKNPKRIFVCDMGDLFHEGVPSDFITKVFAKMIANKQHTFLILTKRAKRMAEHFGEFIKVFPIENIWWGTTVCNQAETNEKIPILLQIPAAHRWVSIEPILGPVNLSRALPIDKYKRQAIESGPSSNLDWIVLGGETGPKARLLHPDWVRSMIQQCKNAGVPFFIKQLNKDDGKDINKWSEDLRIREMPCK